VPSVAFFRQSEEWVVRGEARSGGYNGELLLVREDLPLVTTADLRNALASWRDYHSGPHSPAPASYAQVSELPEEHFDADGPVSPISFDLVDNRLMLTMTCLVSWPENNSEWEAVDRIARLVAPLLAQTRSTLNHIEVNDSWSSALHLGIELRIAPSVRGRTAADLFQQAEDILTLCDAFTTASITRETVADLVRGGGADLLIDQPEGHWLDDKSEEYDLASTRGKINLAKALARFANAEDGGLVVIGAKAKKVPGGEVIRQVRGVAPRQSDTAARYRRALDQHLYPPPYGVRIDLVPTSDHRSLIVIDIPPQPEELKPFLVHGAITADGDTEGSFISIVQRRGEGSIPITAPMIHATIAAGRALLRGKAGDHG
jgi:hypothetical protein